MFYFPFWQYQHFAKKDLHIRTHIIAPSTIDSFFIQQEVAWKKKSVIEKYSNFNLAKTRRRNKRFVKCVTEVNKSPIQSKQKNTKISGFPLLVTTGTYLLMILMYLTCLTELKKSMIKDWYTLGMFRKLVTIVLGLVWYVHKKNIYLVAPPKRKTSVNSWSFYKAC